MKYLLLGGKGLVLSRFVQLNEQAVLPVLDFPEIDITDYDSIGKYIDSQKDGDLVVVLGAAYTDVDGAEREKGNRDGQVYKINVLGPRNVSKICRELGIFLIHISTDFVFSGTPDNKGPHSEKDKPVMDEKNLGWYAQTKLLGEEEVQKSEAEAAVLRISYPFRAKYERSDYARTFLNLYDQGKLFPLFSDQFLTPSFIDEISVVVRGVSEKKLDGVFHCASVDVATPYDFASYLLEKACGVKGVVEQSSMIKFRKDFPDKAPRPQYGGLDSKKTQETLGLKFMTWREQVHELIRQMRDI